MFVCIVLYYGYSCTLLVSLCCYSNEIASLPEVDTTLSCLKELHVSKNCISEFPLPFIAGLMSLVVLEASWNTIC